ncbi:uridine kinase [Tepiditoga spiralis]|uniref:Uridine kinase n=1 Tax=Tepiditoga spiralis TaxID=2108365 RepID=A0A7G1G1I1_9BACT|nr:nucleoside kinase [Tepiditoga spiralis]BBE30141.1 uridine kinase [Tepiditoga spiralis]
MKIKLRNLEEKKVYEIPEGSTFGVLAKKHELETGRTVFAVKYNNNIKELFKIPNEDGIIEFLDLSTSDGVKIYQRGLLFLLEIALKELNKNENLYVQSSIGNGLYCEFETKNPSEDFINKLKEKMNELIEQNLPFKKENIEKFKAIKMFKDAGKDDKALLFKFRKKSTVNIYSIKKYFNYFYGYMPESTGTLKKFDLIKQGNGIVLLQPNQESPDEVPEYRHLEKLSSTFKEYTQWLKIMEIKTVGELNELISHGKESAVELIRVADALHEKKYAMIADEIIKNDKIKLILIAGPSSSGKTTSAKRIALQLKVNGIKTIPISLDDYFVERDKTPRDENGDYDFESINALDLELFNQNMMDLFEGKEVTLPKYNFVTGKREWHQKTLKLEKGQILIVEGIHGLNEKLTNKIPREWKFKIYVSALTQMNLDDVNRIPTTDTRLIRRIVRDFNFRGHSALDTLKMWPSVRKGEEENIFPYQEEADIMFNSHLAYELAVLKIFAEPLLLQVDNTVPEYSEAKRLLRFLDYFLPITELEEIPKKSVIREFIGRSESVKISVY